MEFLLFEIWFLACGNQLLTNRYLPKSSTVEFKFILFYEKCVFHERYRYQRSQLPFGAKHYEMVGTTRLYAF